MSDVIEWLLAIAIVGFGCVLMWVSSASTIAKECEKLGAFYVGQKVYTCEVKKEGKP